MKAQSGDQAYEVLGFQDGTWVSYADRSDECDVTLPQEVYDRLARGLTGKFSIGALLDKANS